MRAYIWTYTALVLGLLALGLVGGCELATLEVTQ